MRAGSDLAHSVAAQKSGIILPLFVQMSDKDAQSVAAALIEAIRPRRRWPPSSRIGRDELIRPSLLVGAGGDDGRGVGGDPELTVIVVSYRSRDLTLGALRTLFATATRNWIHVVVFDERPAMDRPMLSRRSFPGSR